MSVTLAESETKGFVALGFPYKSRLVVGSCAIVDISQYNMIVNYNLKGYAYQSALPYKYQTLMDSYVEAVDCDKVLNFKKLLLEEGGNDIIFNGPDNFIYAFYDTFGEGRGSNRGKYVIGFSLGGCFKVYDPNQVK